MGNVFVNPEDIYQGVIETYSERMNIYEIRRENLARLIESRFDGRQRGLADAIDRQPDYISRVLKGAKNIGEAFARHVEKSLGLQTGALDIVILDEAHHAEKANEGHTGAAATPIRRDPQWGLDELEFFGRMDAWDSNTPLGEDEVELPLFREVELAAGGGATQVIENRGAKLRFAKSTLSRAGVPPEAAACAFLRGHSMHPVMPDGTCVGVNTADTAIRDGEIYAIDHGGMLRIKYLHRRPGGGIRIVSQNSAEFPTEELTAEEMAGQVRVIGRVFWWSVLR